MKKILITLASCAMIASCSPDAKREDESATGRQDMLDSVNAAMALQRVTDSMESARTVTLAPITPNATNVEPARGGHRSRPDGPVSGTVKTPAPAGKDKPAATPSTPPASPEPTVATTPSAPAGNGGGTASNDSGEVKKKKGLNNAAKGAIIGLGTGAAAGAVIGGKGKRVQGAVIGGILGAGAGAVGGAVLDKRKKNKAAKDSAAAANDTTSQK